MKESKFIELLNLYIDQQISPEEVARLEEEIIANPRRRRTYQQYCRMHRACTLVFAQYSPHAEHAAETDWRSDDRIEFRPRRTWWRWGQYAAGVAAMGCLAVLGTRVYLHVARTAPPPATVAKTAPTPAPTVAAAVPVATLPAGRFVAQRLYLTSPMDSERGASLVLTSTPARVTPLPVAQNGSASSRPTIEQFVFQPDATTPVDNTLVFRGRSSANATEEMAAYQFQR